MALLKGQTIILVATVEVGRDAFNYPIYEKQEIPVENVLVTPVSSEDITNEIELYTKHAVCCISIPKGDTHTWLDNDVIINGETWTVFTFAKEYDTNLTPLSWDKQYYCERFNF